MLAAHFMVHCHHLVAKNTCPKLYKPLKIVIKIVNKIKFQSKFKTFLEVLL